MRLLSTTFTLYFVPLPQSWEKLKTMYQFLFKLISVSTPDGASYPSTLALQRVVSKPETRGQAPGALGPADPRIRHGDCWFPYRDLRKKRPLRHTSWTIL